MDQKQSLSLVIGANDTWRTDCENGAKQLAHVFRQLGDETTLLAGNGTRSILTDFFNSTPKNTMTFLSLVVIGTTMVDRNGALHARLSSGVDCIDGERTIAFHELFSMANKFTTTHQASLFVWLDISGVVPTNETVYKFFNDAIDWNHKNVATLVPIEPYAYANVVMPWPKTFFSDALLRPLPPTIGRFTAALLCGLLGAARFCVEDFVISSCCVSILHSLKEADPRFNRAYNFLAIGWGRGSQHSIEWSRILDTGVRSTDLLDT